MAHGGVFSMAVVLDEVACDVLPFLSQVCLSANAIFLCSTYLNELLVCVLTCACVHMCESGLCFCMLITQVNLFTLWRILIRFLRHLLALSHPLFFYHDVNETVK